MATELRTPILEQGIANTHFFNGRLLTAEALRAEQEANRQQRQRLGQAIGGGVVYGLQVQGTSTTSQTEGATSAVVRVTAGLGDQSHGTDARLTRQHRRLTGARE